MKCGSYSIYSTRNTRHRPEPCAGSENRRFRISVVRQRSRCFVTNTFSQVSQVEVGNDYLCNEALASNHTRTKASSAESPSLTSLPSVVVASNRASSPLPIRAGIVVTDSSHPDYRGETNTRSILDPTARQLLGTHIQR
jgi:hypothetical protein